jgi:hypothetical protein
MGVGGQYDASTALAPGRGLRFYCRGGCVGPGGDLDRYGEEKISCLHWGSNPVARRSSDYQLYGAAWQNCTTVRLYSTNKCTELNIHDYNIAIVTCFGARASFSRFMFKTKHPVKFVTVASYKVQLKYCYLDSSTTTLQGLSPELDKNSTR